MGGTPVTDEANLIYLSNATHHFYGDATMNCTTHHNAERGRDAKGRFLPRSVASGHTLDGQTHHELPEALAGFAKGGAA